MKFRENGEFISPKVAPDRTDPMDAKIILSIIRGSVIFKLIKRIASGITVVIVKRKEPLKKLIRDEKRKKINGMRVFRVDPVNKNPIKELENPSFLARDSIDMERTM